jgi:hypothetical protein
MRRKELRRHAHNTIQVFLQKRTLFVVPFLRTGNFFLKALSFSKRLPVIGRLLRVSSRQPRQCPGVLQQ